MKALILAAGKFDDSTRKKIGAGEEPRLDVFEIADRLGATTYDYGDVEASDSVLVRTAHRVAGASAALALLGMQVHKQYDVILTSGEDIGIPLAALLKGTDSRTAHAMIVHTLAPKKKRVFFELFGIQTRVDHALVYARTEESLLLRELGFRKEQVERIYYHADEQFFRPAATPPEPDLICAAGQLLRDYDCLVRAVADLPVRVQIAAGSPWITQDLRPKADLPKNIAWGKLNRFELRSLYERAALAVVPIQQNVYQTGIATILEMMAMGKCVIATKTIGQTDTIVDGETGVYVPPGDAGALRATIQRLLAAPDEARRIGQNARRFMEQEAGLDLFVTHVIGSMNKALENRRSPAG